MFIIFLRHSPKCFMVSAVIKIRSVDDFLLLSFSLTFFFLNFFKLY